MRTSKSLLLLAAAGLLLAIPACGGQSEEAKFQSNFEEAVKAADKGKELVKSPVKRKR